MCVCVCVCVNQYVPAEVALLYLHAASPRDGVQSQQGLWHARACTGQCMSASRLVVCASSIAAKLSLIVAY